VGHVPHPIGIDILGVTCSKLQLTW